MRDALRNIAGLGVPVHEAVRMAASAPARIAGIGDQHGSIEEGKRADLVPARVDIVLPQRHQEH
jgi:imidazolonepropionase-like amidohydrolase